MQYIISDIHGNAKELEKLMGIIKPDSSDKLIFLGDYIDKGNETKKTLEILTNLSKQFNTVFLKGNHDYVWEEYLNKGKVERKDFLLKYGGDIGLSDYFEDPIDMINNNKIDQIKKHLSSFLEIMSKSKSYEIADEFIALHAGLMIDQINDENLIFHEKNFFLRPQDIETETKYLEKFTQVAGHNRSNEPIIKPGYIGIDLGAGNGGEIGCLIVEEKVIISSGGKKFSIY